MNYDSSLDLNIQFINSNESKTDSYSFYIPVFSYLTIKEKNIIYNNDGSFNRVRITEDIFKNSNPIINKTIKNHLKEQVGNYFKIIESGQKIHIGNDLPKEYAYSKSTRVLPNNLKITKGRMSTNLKEIIEHASSRKWEQYKHDSHKVNAKYGFYKYKIKFSIMHKNKEKIYTGNILIRNDANGKKYLYDILKIKQKID